MTVVGAILIGLAAGAAVLSVAPAPLVALTATIIPPSSWVIEPELRHVVQGVSALVYLSGVILIAAGLLKRAALSELRILAHQRRDLEGLQTAVLLAVENLEERLREANSQNQLSHRMLNLAAEFDRLASASEEPEALDHHPVELGRL